ncbi:IS630-Spn1, transposase Orf2 [Streptococcus pneumoniae]|nr:IS630-Spn1, transposase Orf2 [Streptococcus pneumoniae]
MVAGLTNGELIAPMTYEETMTSDFYARFHRMGKLELLCEEFGYKLLPLPPYSPEYNPIEAL